MLNEDNADGQTEDRPETNKRFNFLPLSEIIL